MKGLLTAALLALPIGASAQCSYRAHVVEFLDQKHSENRRMAGLSSNGMMVEVFVSEDTGSWTITATHANGMTCLIAAGQSADTVAVALSPRGEEG